MPERFTSCPPPNKASPIFALSSLIINSMVGELLLETQPAALRKIVHVNVDAFYAPIEQLDDHALCGKPVVVIQCDTGPPSRCSCR